MMMMMMTMVKHVSMGRARLERGELWCPVDIRDHEQGHVTKRVCACMGVRARVRCVTLCCSSC